MDRYFESIKQRLNKQVASMRTEFSRHEPRLRDLADNFMPRRARWNKSDFGNGDKVNSNIINNTPLVAVRVVASGLQAGVTNPLAEWFRLTTPDPELADWGPVKAHLYERQRRIRAALGLGTFYRGMGELWLDDIWAGFGCAFLEDHPERLVMLAAEMIGEFYMAADENGEINTVARDLPMTVRQVIRRFALKADKTIDWSVLSPTVKSLYQQGKLDATVEVVNVVEPNEDMEPGRLGPRGMAYASRWWERGGDDDRFLRIAGYEEFPALCPRWAPRTGEAYSRGLADDALGDAKELQHEERRTAGMLDKIVNPPMVADEATRGQRKSLVSGDVTYQPRGQGEGFKPAMEIRQGALGEGKEHIYRTEQRIDRGMMVEFFLSLLNDKRAQRATAREIEELSQQTALQLGPMLESTNPTLKHAVDRVDAMLERRGFMPPPPPELQGMDLNVEFISPMHQAQKGIQLGPIRVFMTEMSVLASMKPSALDKVNEDDIADQIADATGIAPTALLSSEEVEQTRQARAQREQALQAGQAMAAAAKGAKDLGTTPAPAPDNALGAVLSNLSPGQATGAALQTLGPVAGAGFPN